jgi:hypothetical protein
MNHRRSYSDSDIKVLDDDESLDDASDDESVVSSSVHTVDLYTGWRLPDLTLSVRLPGWFVLLITLLLFRGQSPSCVV